MVPRAGAHRSKSTPSAGSAGYALAVVLIAIAAFLLFAGLTTNRIIREVRVSKVEEYSNQALYAADGGFNRARARIITYAKGNTNEAKITDPDPSGLNGRVETLTYTDPISLATEPGGTYRLTVTKADTPANTYNIVSVGTYGTGVYEVRRVVAGTVTFTTSVKNGVTTVTLTTTYTP
ncbi:MAG: hypothetical protein ACM3XM_12190 [Mycobacterium leprae]